MSWKIAVGILAVVVVVVCSILQHGTMIALSRGALEGAGKEKGMRHCRCGATWDPTVQAHRYCRLANKRRRWYQWRKREEV